MKKILCIICLALSALPVRAQAKKDPLFAEVEALMANGREQAADVLCADNFSNALNHYLKAEKLRDEGASAENIREELEKSVADITLMNDGLEKKMDFFNSQITLRKAALDSKADKYALTSWKLGEKYFNKAVKEVSYENYNDAEELLPDINKYYEDAKASGDIAVNYLFEWTPLKNANTAMANLLSPQNYKQGISIFNKAMKKISDNSEKEDINELISEAGTYFNDADQKAKEYSQHYPDVLKERNVAKVALAENYAADSWLLAEKYLSNSAEYYEEEDIEDAADLSETALNQYKDARHDAVKARFLKLAADQIALAESMGAEDLAPKTYKNSVDIYSLADYKVDRDHYTEEEVYNAGNAAFSEAGKAIRIVEIIKNTEAGENTWEDVILGGNIVPDNIYPTILTDLNKNVHEKREVEEEETPIPEVRHYSDLYKIFTPGEAEIEETSNQVIIRLIGMEFVPLLPNLNDSDIKILRKANEALKLFPNSDITIEGHTDNVCTRNMNNKISQERADAVRDYFIRNFNISSSRLSAVGYGESQPISDNTTTEGRKKNRRIDLVIDL